MMPNITDYENGCMAHEAIAEFFQGMINSGVVWQLQGHYGRTAVELIEAGDCMTADAFAATEAVAVTYFTIVHCSVPFQVSV